MKPTPVVEGSLKAADGTEITYHVVGQGQPVLLANGLGGSYHAWSHLIRHLADRYRFISWDYRGLYRSGPPSHEHAIDVPDHAGDGLAVLDQLGVDSAAIVGWSMGVQVALEAFRLAPERVSNLVLINGVAGKVWTSFLDVPVFDPLVPRILRGARAVPRVLDAVTKRAVGWPELLTWTHRVGLTGSTIDSDLFLDVAHSFRDLDMRYYARLLEMLGRHDAYDVLPTIDVPTLIIAGGRDKFTPRRAAERMVRVIPGAEWMLVPGATHFAAIEFPELVNLRIEKFFRERGYGQGA